MLHKHELDEEIAALENQKNHKPSDLAYLGALYAVRDHAFGVAEPVYDTQYSRTAEPVTTSDTLERYGDSDFLIAIAGKAPADVWKALDRHMDNLHIVNPKMYEGVLRKMRQL